MSSFYPRRRTGEDRKTWRPEAPTGVGSYSLKPVRELVADHLRQAILDGTLKPGQKIVEAEVCDEMSITRVTLREALRQLEKEGLVRNLTSRGIFVCYLSTEDLVQLYGIRCALEELAASWACRYIDEAELEDLHRLCYEMQNILPLRTEEERLRLLRKDAEFHGLLVEASRSTRLADALAGVRLQIRMIQAAATLAGVASAQSASEHESIVNAIARRDSQAAAEAARIHVEKSRDRILQAFANGER